MNKINDEKIVICSSSCICWHIRLGTRAGLYRICKQAGGVARSHRQGPVNTLSAYLAITPRIGIWSVNATAGIEKQDLYLDVTGPSGTYRVYCDKPRYTLNAFNTFTLKHGWQFDINLMYRSSGYSYNFYNDTYNLRLGLVAQKSLLKNNALTIRCAVLDCLQRNRVNESGDLGYNQFRQCNRFSTHKFFLSLVYRLNATRSKYKGTGAGKAVIERMQ